MATTEHAADSTSIAPEHNPRPPEPDEGHIPPVVRRIVAEHAEAVTDFTPWEETGATVVVESFPFLAVRELQREGYTTGGMYAQPDGTVSVYIWPDAPATPRRA